MIEPILKAQLSRDEGRLLYAYLDSEGYWTIGVGHLLERKKNVARPRMAQITDDECDALLAMDVEIAVKALGRVFTNLHRIDGPRLRAMVNMMFNRGEDAVEKSTTITPALKTALDVMSWKRGEEEWKAVGNAILASEWGKQIKARGERLAKQFETGVDQ